MIRISDRAFDRAVQAALDGIPAEFKRYLDNVMVEVRRRVDPALLAECDEADDLLGLYIGLPLEEKAASHAAPLPDRILIFRDNLCEICESFEQLVEQIRITVLHEVGHHFGLDEDKLSELGYD